MSRSPAPAAVAGRTDGPGTTTGAYSPAPLAGSTLVVGTLALAAATFMIVLDTSIANVSLPAIAGEMGVSPNQGTWVITSFAVANAIAVPLTGWLTQRFGQVRLFCLSTALFVVASWLCGMAPTFETLIAFRVLQGAVAGPLIPLSQALLLSSYPAAKAGTALAMWSMTTLIAPVAGPLLGGWITDNYAWPWIFYINIPVGIAASWLTWTIYRDRESPTRKLPIDGVGLGLLVLWIAALQIMLDKGKELDWFASDAIVVLAIVAVVGFVFFLIWELHEEHPVVDLRLFAGRSFTVGTLVTAVSYGVFFGTVVLLPLWVQTQLGYTATDAGFVLAPVGILALLLSPFVGRSIPRVDPRLIATISFVIFAVVCYMRSQFNTEVDLFTLMVPTIVQGAAVACFFVPLVAITLVGLPPAMIPSASGLSNFARITAGAFGTSIFTTLWDDRASLHHAQLVETLDPSNPAVGPLLDRLRAAGMDTTQALARVNDAVTQQAYSLAFNDVFYLSALIFVALMPLVWLARRPPVRAHAGGATGSGAASTPGSTAASVASSRSPVASLSNVASDSS
ncbi:MAG: DHA2 family efflux MFS transporter permease subunit [Burkholderiales bacterium]|nr:DHA2 family efflux MFS transporter permease subunit [Burkholderiales bacterium]